ncbi:MAG: SDR family oxidoreductase, partial [Pseudomonadota bacterium]
MQNVLMIGSGSQIAQAISQALPDTSKIYELSRQNTDYCEDSLRDHAGLIVERFESKQPLDLVISCIGFLKNDVAKPEKRFADLNSDALLEYYRINTVIPTLCIKHFAPLLNKTTTAKFALLSAMVGSIQENELGGWYGYRSSKSALNMVVRSAAIEIRRTH